jgi:hypothetical protein
MSRIPGLVWNVGTAIQAIGDDHADGGDFGGHRIRRWTPMTDSTCNAGAPFTPEGQIESAGRFARGLGPTVLRRIIGVVAVVLVVIGVIGLVASR